MKILAISDVPSKLLWDESVRKRLEGIDLILSCGDLPKKYLEYLTNFTTAPILYVHGNHDGRYEEDPPLGCICIDGMLYEHQGVRIVGLGGSMRYNGGPFQYTEGQMRRRAMRLAPRICFKGGFDILLTHSPGRDMVPCTDLAHTGFQTFNQMLDKYRPALFLHGHTHMNYGRGIRREQRYGDTRVVNSYERCLVEL